MEKIFNCELRNRVYHKVLNNESEIKNLSQNKS